jgi:hypothetical protein
MNFTFRNNVWKGDATNSIIPTNARPFTNIDKNLKTVPRMQGRANPIKHWRKQLDPYYETKSSKQVSIDQINAPNSIVYIKGNSDLCDTNNYQLLKENIALLNNCVGIRYVDENNISRCIGGSHNVKRRASTNIKKGYYTSHSKYLQAKCKTFEQNTLLGSKIDDKTYSSSICSDVTMNCKKPIIYKPSNKAFSTQGGVSASSNIARKRNLALTNNYNSLRTVYGSSYVKAVSYNVGSTGYEIKYIKGNNNVNSVLNCEQVHKTCKKN